MSQPIKHSEYRIIRQSGLFENEIEPGVLHSSVQQTRALDEYEMYKPSATDYVSILSGLRDILADCMFVERWTGALQVQPRFRNT